MSRDPNSSKILLVCTGNICRSPMAEVVLKALAQSTNLAAQLRFGSAGTHTNRGRIDPRAKLVLEKNGYSIEKKFSRQLVSNDFNQFDLILAMDRENMLQLTAIAPPSSQGKLSMFLDFAPGMKGQEVPDPYYGNVAGFERVLELCETAAEGLLDHLKFGRDALRN